MDQGHFYTNTYAKLGRNATSSVSLCYLPHHTFLYLGNLTVYAVGIQWS